MRESDIQRAILDWLKANRFFAWRCNLGGVRVKGATARNPMKGFPDIGGILPGGVGRKFVIEVKTKTGALSPEQVAWKEKLETAGCLYILARSVDDVAYILTAYERFGA